MFKSVDFQIKEHPLVFDDGGLIYSNPNNTGFKIDVKVYERILFLAKNNNIKIPIACNAAFFDIDNISKLYTVNPKAEKILKIFDNNKEYLEIWNHGLNHRFKNECTEFYSYDAGTVSYNYQLEHLKLSQEIFNKLCIKPTVFVPPGHAWEQGVTDKIAKEVGIDTIAIREFEKTNFKSWIKNPFKPYKETWGKSEHINTLFRLGLGISFDKIYFNEKSKQKMFDYVSNQFPKSVLINRKFKLKYPVDHFFAHIQNLQKKESVEYFNFTIKKIKKLYL